MFTSTAAAIENSNYHNDHRVRAGYATRWFESLDEQKMTATISIGCEACPLEESCKPNNPTIPNCTGIISHQVKFTWSLCETCQGKGRHVNPSIDSNGLSADDLYSDPDFAEGYFRGDYDQICNECDGNRVVPTPDPDDRFYQMVIDAMVRDAEYDAICAAERRMGA